MFYDKCFCLICMLLVCCCVLWERELCIEWSLNPPYNCRLKYTIWTNDNLNWQDGNTQDLILFLPSLNQLPEVCWKRLTLCIWRPKLDWAFTARNQPKWWWWVLATGMLTPRRIILWRKIQGIAAKGVWGGGRGSVLSFLRGQWQYPCVRPTLHYAEIDGFHLW